MKNLTYSAIELSDNDSYRQHLALCEDVPADLSTACIWGYSHFAPTSRAYADGLYWQHQQLHGDEFEFAPVGDWDRADWPALFNKYVTPGTVFEFVPACLKDRWEAIFPGRFTVSTNRDNWDYIYDFEHFAADTKEKRSKLKKFHESYEYTVVPITSANVGEVIRINDIAEVRIRSSLGACSSFTELNDDDKSMSHILRNWDAIDTVEGLLIKVDDEYVSYKIWDAVDDRVICLFSKNKYTYVGMSEVTIEEFCRIGLDENRKWVNWACDAGVEGLREAKTTRNPVRLMDKYRMTWLG